MQTSKPNWSKQSRKQRFIFFQFGLVIAIALAIMAFEWSVEKRNIILTPPDETTELIEFDFTPPSSHHTNPVVPKPKHKSLTFRLNPVDNAVSKDNTIKPDDNIKEQPDLFTNVNTNPPPEPPDTVYEPFQKLEKEPSFPGGEEVLQKYIRDKFNELLRACDKDERISGKIGFEFIIDKDGSAREPVILRGLNPCMNQAAIKMILSMPRWNPGTQRSKPVMVRYRQAISYKYKMR